jgi:uncharacterized protein YqgV (UPF0045/DUF77 family)
MDASIEISMYPLSEDFDNRIIAFIDEIKQNPDLRVDVNGLSTQIFGELNHLFEILRVAISNSFNTGHVVFVLKVAPGERTIENLPEILKS